MYRLVRLSPAMFFIFIISGIIAVIAAYVPNYEKKVYESTSKNTSIVGYPAGDYIPRVTSVDDINQCEVFTAYIKGKDIQQTGIYVKNKYSGNDYYVASKNYLYDEIDRIFNNFDNVSYSEYCILKLSSGEKIIAFLDINLLDIKDDEYIMLPIGEKKYFSGTNLISDIKDRSEVNNENAKWYVDMSGYEWRQNVLGNSVSKKRNTTLVLTFILSFIAITFILYKYAEFKIGDDFEG